MGSLLPYPVFKAFDDQGLPLAGGKLYFYAAGTVNTPKSAYVDFGYTVPASNPLILDSRGEGMAYLQGGYKLVLSNPDDTVVWTKDNIYGVNTGLEMAAALAIPSTYVFANNTDRDTYFTANPTEKLMPDGTGRYINVGAAIQWWNGSSWVVVTPVFQGSPGSTGATGATGPAGPTGPSGSIGPVGIYSGSAVMSGLGSIVPPSCVITIPTGAIYVLEAVGVGTDAAHSNYSFYRITGAFFSNGGVIQQLGASTTILATYEAGSAAQDLRFVHGIYGLAANQVGLSIEGPGGVTMTWYTTISILASVAP